MDSSVIIVEDDDAARNSLLFLLRSEGVRSRAFSSAEGFLSVVEPAYTGCIVTDLKMPGLDGIGLTARLHELGYRIPVILITGHGDVPAAVRAMKAGVVDFIEKPFKSETLLASIRHCLAVSEQAEVDGNERAILERRRQRLTKRESQVLEHLVLGRANKEIAQILNISFRTVEIYRMSLMAKMHADNLADLVRMSFKLEGGHA